MEQKPAAAATTGEAKSGSSMVMKMVVGVLFLAIVIGIECAVAFYVFPSAEDVATLANAQHAGKAEPGHDSPLAAELLDIKGRQEIDLGEFTVTAYQPLSNTTLRIDFKLFGVVLAENAETLTKLLEENKHRFREQVLVIVRSAEMTDLTDAGLGLIKRKVLEKTNRVLGQAVIEEIIFSDFSFIEQ